MLQRANSSLSRGVYNIQKRGVLYAGPKSQDYKIITVFGAYGQLGSYVVDILARAGARVVVPFRGSDTEVRHLKLLGNLGTIFTIPYHPRDRDSIKTAVERSDAVINLIGKHYQTKHIVGINYTFDQVHVEVARNIAEVSKEAGVERFAQMSALGVDLDSPSPFLRTKALGELAVKEIWPNATFYRPARMYSHEDRFLNLYAALARNFGIIPLLNEGSALVQPVYAVDVATAIYHSFLTKESLGKTYSLTGPKTYTYREVAEYVLDAGNIEAVTADIPQFLLEMATKFMDHFPNPILSIDEGIQMGLDNVLDPKDGTLTFDDLEIKPKEMEIAAFDFMYQYRTKSHFVDLEKSR